MKYFARILASLLLLGAAPAVAGESVKSPNVEQGLLEIEQKGRYQSDSALPKDHLKEFEYNIIYGVTNHWKTKLELVTDDDKKGDPTYRRTRFENVLQLTKAKNGFFADTALYNDFTIADRSDSSHDVTFGVLARKDIADFSNTANVYVKKDFGDTAQAGINFIYRWQTKYNLMPAFQPGFEILGDTKKQNAFRDGTLGIGPSVFGNLGFDELFGADKAQKLGYEVVYTFGATPATADATLKWKLKYAIQF
ncbi:MAG: hypothetical protein SFW65_00350 [Alphaproteobacteria bacterium]|nr:hypothetical protein [Alphaproteobacteria bacterium]